MAYPTLIQHCHTTKHATKNPNVQNRRNQNVTDTIDQQATERARPHKTESTKKRYKQKQLKNTIFHRIELLFHFYKIDCIIHFTFTSIV